MNFPEDTLLDGILPELVPIIERYHETTEQYLKIDAAFRIMFGIYNLIGPILSAKILDAEYVKVICDAAIKVIDKQVNNNEYENITYF